MPMPVPTTGSRTFKRSEGENKSKRQGLASAATYYPTGYPMPGPIYRYPAITEVKRIMLLKRNSSPNKKVRQSVCKDHGHLEWLKICPWQWRANPNPDLDSNSDLPTFAKSGGFGFAWIGIAIFWDGGFGFGSVATSGWPGRPQNRENFISQKRPVLQYLLYILQSLQLNSWGYIS